MEELIKRLRAQLYAKPAPGEVLNNITEAKLRELVKIYPCDQEVLWVGSYLADLFIFEAKEKGKIAEHIPMAIEHAKQLTDEYSIPAERAEIILEIIATHHGGEQKHIESKLYKNADCFKFLDPRGVFHIFAAFYQNNEASFKEAIKYALFKIEEKRSLIDLDENLKREAEDLYQDWQAIFRRMPYQVETPELYR